MESGDGGSSAADVDVPAFDECVTEKETRIRERGVARG